MHIILAILLLFTGVEIPENLMVELEGESIANVNRSHYTQPLPGVPIVIEKRLNQLMDEIEMRVRRDPVNASLDGNGRILSEKTGSKLDRGAFILQFHQFIYEGAPAKVQVPLMPIYPKVDSELLSAIKVKKIGQYSTYYNSNNKNRSYNIGLSAKAINNHVVFPGESFSFNGVVGKRTKEKGYLRAPVIVRGEVSEDIGGGICQTSSTLFNAVDRAGLQIIKRYSHSKNVPYVPSGRDATVSWYGPDFVFQNKYSQPILIRAFANAGTISIAIYSSDDINVKNREVPNASRKLPEEIRTEMDASGIRP